jgi:CBS domain-containing protein
MQPEAALVRPENTLAEAIEVMLRARYHDVPVEKDGALQGIVTWSEIIKVKPEQRNQLRIEQMPMKQLHVFEDESILEASKIMNREKIDLLPVVDKQVPTKVLGVITGEAVAQAYEKAKNLR